MLYLDSSALIKRYIHERGSSAIEARLQAGEKVFTSVFSFAEIHTVLGRKQQNRELTGEAYGTLVEKFIRDWLFSLSPLELDEKTMADLPDLVRRFPLKAADAVHLASALWLYHTSRLVPSYAEGEQRLQFGVSDKQLARVALECGLDVFDPEAGE